MYSIQRSTLASAISAHVQDRAEQEKNWGYTGDSGHLAVLRELLQKLKQGEQIQVVGEL